MSGTKQPFFVAPTVPWSSNSKLPPPSFGAVAEMVAAGDHSDAKTVSVSIYIKLAHTFVPRFS